MIRSRKRFAVIANCVYDENFLIPSSLTYDSLENFSISNFNGEYTESVIRKFILYTWYNSLLIHQMPESVFNGIGYIEKKYILKFLLK